MQTDSTTPTSDSLIPEADSAKPLGRYNYIGMIAAGILIVIGFCLMVGGASTGDTFNPEIFSTRRLVVGPMLAFLGFVLMAVAIILSPARLNRLFNK